ncbi:hypothetical protein [Crucivirus-432]|nr:hypothetical protein [Crucivirus-432]
MSNSYIVSAQWLVTGNEKEVMSAIQAMMKVSCSRSSLSAHTVPLSLNYQMISNALSLEKKEEQETKDVPIPQEEKIPTESAPWTQTPSFATDVVWEFPSSPLQ